MKTSMSSNLIIYLVAFGASTFLYSIFVPAWRNVSWGAKEHCFATKAFSCVHETRMTLHESSILH